MRRARPVVLTALAAILAMIPLSRSAFWGPMAITIMGGLFVATFLTLLFLPSLYALWYRKRLDERGQPGRQLSGRCSDAERGRTACNRGRMTMCRLRWRGSLDKTKKRKRRRACHDRCD